MRSYESICKLYGGQIRNGPVKCGPGSAILCAGIGATVFWDLLADSAGAASVGALFLSLFSRNIDKRCQENSRFLLVWNPIKRWFQQQKRRWKERKTHRYYHCPKCKNTLRVPKGIGKICITCPVCRTEFIKKT